MSEFLANVKIIFFDFDGVFTNNHVLVDENGKESVSCYRSDGIGLSKLNEFGIFCMVVSTENNPVVSFRCKKLGIQCIQGCDNKWKVVSGILSEKGLVPEQAAFVGNDIPDLECMRCVGFPFAVADAYPKVKDAAKLITTCKGGEGAVREVCDLIIEARQANG